jgi:hypothetical protein
MEASLKSSCVSVLSFLHSFVYLWCWICHNVQNVKLYNGPFLPIYEIRWGTRPPLTLKKVYMITIYRDFFKIISRIYRDTPSNKWSFGSQLTTHKYITVLRFVFTFREAKDRKLAYPLHPLGAADLPYRLASHQHSAKIQISKEIFSEANFIPAIMYLRDSLIPIHGSIHLQSFFSNLVFPFHIYIYFLSLNTVVLILREKYNMQSFCSTMFLQSSVSPVCHFCSTMCSGHFSCPQDSIQKLQIYQLTEPWVTF